jgi:hypothetical protein
MCRHSGSSTLAFPQNPARVPLLPMRATCPAHFILLQLIIAIISDE